MRLILQRLGAPGNRDEEGSKEVRGKGKVIRNCGRGDREQRQQLEYK